MGRLRDGDSEGRAFMKGRERIFIRLGKMFFKVEKKEKQSIQWRNLAFLFNRIIHQYVSIYPANAPTNDLPKGYACVHQENVHHGV